MAAETSWPRVLLRSEDSDNRLSVIETALAPGVSPPLHVHDFEETFYVMEGELIFRVRDEYFHGQGRATGVRAARRAAYLRQPQRCPRPSIDHLYTGRV
jgi:predicted metal-dependent enzyme (double-stranded beta helix superfamily)